MDVYNQSMQSGHGRSISLWENTLSFSRLYKQIFCPWFYRLSVTLYLICFSEVPWNVASKTNIQKQHGIYFPWNTRGQARHSPAVSGHTDGCWVTVKPPTQPPHCENQLHETNSHNFKAHLLSILLIVYWGFPLRGFHCCKLEPINTVRAVTVMTLGNPWALGNTPPQPPSYPSSLKTAIFLSQMTQKAGLSQEVS